MLKNFGEDEVFDYKREKWYTKFTGVAAERDFVYALDSQWQRVYLFDKEGNRLAVFGAQGEQTVLPECAGYFGKRPRRLCTGPLKQNITVFEPTEYGKLIMDAVALYNQGKYQEAIEPLAGSACKDANNQMAYSGIGEALMKAGDYNGAVHNFRLAYNYERESVAFEYYRAQLLREHIGIVVVLMLLLVIALMLFTNRKFLGFLGKSGVAQKKRGAQGMTERLKIIGSVLRSPVSAYNELKHRRYTDRWLVLVILGLWFLVRILKRQFYGFRFQTQDPQ